MDNINLMCTPGYPLSGGTRVCTTGAAHLLKAATSRPGIAAHAVMPLQRERFAAAAVVPSVRVRTIDFVYVPSALTRERRT